MAGIVLLDAFCTCAIGCRWHWSYQESVSKRGVRWNLNTWELPEYGIPWHTFQNDRCLGLYDLQMSRVKVWKGATKKDEKGTTLKRPWLVLGRSKLIFRWHLCIRKSQLLSWGRLSEAKVQILIPGPQEILHLGLSRQLLMSAWECTLLKRWRSCVSRPCGMAQGFAHHEEQSQIMPWLPWPNAIEWPTTLETRT